MRTEESDPQRPDQPKGRYLLTLALTATGVVYGDIGTSPLYAIRECFGEHNLLQVTPANILGVLSLIFWSLVLVISLKYLVFILRADNHGEGGILALTALVAPLQAQAKGGRLLLILLGLFGAALLYGDGMITPAISVLSAVEGLGVATPLFDPYIIPLTVAILVGLFWFQHKGTAGVGAIFGPITLVWFVVLSALGIHQILRQPGVIKAVNPWYGLEFFLQNGGLGFLVLGSVFLVVTGGEALYADMGHFGTRPIRLAWFAVALPALLLNYFGQGALLIRQPELVINPFYHMAPDWALYPLVVMATLATVIASQAVISGAFSLTRQAIQLGYSPRLDIEHTSAREMGQIYLPTVNWALMAACICLVLGFRSSSHLAAAYGVAVTTTMVITTLLFYFVAVHRWHWPVLLAAVLSAGFLVFDLAFFGANMLKIAHGGWFPILVAALVFTAMTTWKRGRRLLMQRLRGTTTTLESFLANLDAAAPTRVPGTAVFMNGDPERTPSALLHNLKHNRVLHERVLILSAITEEIPHVPRRERTSTERLGAGIYRIILHYGFMENPDVPRALSRIALDGWEFDPAQATYFLGRETLISTSRPGMARWREHLFIFMSRNARNSTFFFGLPPNQVVELGAQLEI
ncbi:potassium transporter Kup [Desulfuromonas carbonis]|uniref:potassium transporter Kup n=1 Tax=Desulfuromonas sp. DDH964 TaxID=1823759 RepID=UPI00078C9125|nr:potassium transporter Kup [Desulfuromonas sp. DDH964]AMV70940.1 potassium uptake protein, Kup system [Desulfuromonas sp. DDH964]